MSAIHALPSATRKRTLPLEPGLTEIGGERTIEVSSWRPTVQGGPPPASCQGLREFGKWLVRSTTKVVDTN